MVSAEATVARTPEMAKHTLTLLESSSVFGCVVFDEGGNILWLNQKFRQWLASTSAANGDFDDLSSLLSRPKDRAALQRAIEAGGVLAISLQLGCIQSTAIPVEGDVVLFGKTERGRTYAGFFHEAVSGEKLNAGMERRARLEALGSLTSGVAHDFNNLLTILVGNLSLVAEELRNDPRHFSKLKAARDAANSGGELIKQLLTFARQEPVASDLINPSKVIARIAPLVQRALGSRITFQLELDEQLDPVQGNSAQLESVIVNLAINARDAIDQKGRVRICVKSLTGNAVQADPNSADPGRLLSITVSDDGPGVPPEILERVFEPFFTTKAEGQGSGLGLSMVRLYAEQFGGTAEIQTRLGEGTTVSLQFPMAAGTANDSAAMTMPLAALSGGNESVVLVARDENLNAMVNQILTALGYQVRIAADLDAAASLFEESSADLVVCDDFQIGSVFESYSKAGTKPGPVLMLQAMGAAETSNSYHVLHKPFSIPDLAVAVREILDAD